MPAQPRIKAIEAYAKGIKYERICLSCWMNIINKWLPKQLVLHCQAARISFLFNLFRFCLGFGTVVDWYFSFQLLNPFLLPVAAKLVPLILRHDSYQLRCISRDCKCDDIGEQTMMADLARESEPASP